MGTEGRQVRDLLRGADRAALATALADGAPYASLVLTALDLDASPVLPSAPVEAVTAPAPWSSADRRRCD